VAADAPEEPLLALALEMAWMTQRLVAHTLNQLPSCAELFQERLLSGRGEDRTKREMGMRGVDDLEADVA